MSNTKFHTHLFNRVPFVKRTGFWACESNWFDPIEVDECLLFCRVILHPGCHPTAPVALGKAGRAWSLVWKVGKSPRCLGMMLGANKSCEQRETQVHNQKCHLSRLHPNRENFTFGLTVVRRSRTVTWMWSYDLEGKLARQFLVCAHVHLGRIR